MQAAEGAKWILDPENTDISPPSKSMEASHRSFEGLDSSVEAKNEVDGDKAQREPRLESAQQRRSEEDKVRALHDDFIGCTPGSEQVISGPYGNVPCVYMDWTASGRTLKGVENYLQRGAPFIWKYSHQLVPHGPSVYMLSS
jgi:hypothetical protein